MQPSETGAGNPNIQSGVETPHSRTTKAKIRLKSAKKE
jgi:hypothetical protein